MRVAWLIVVGIGALGCKDPDSRAARPAATPPATTPANRPTGAEATPAPPAAGSAAAIRAPERPSLDVAREFDAEQEDRAWADATRAQLQTVAPELTDVTCRERQCRGTLIARSETELVEKAEQLQGPKSLRSAEGVRNILLTAPEQVDGKLAMKIYVRYNR